MPDANHPCSPGKSSLVHLSSKKGGSKCSWIALGSILLLILFYFSYRFLEQPVEWTPGNSLVLSPAPGVSDGQDVQSLTRAIDSSLLYYSRLPGGFTFSLGKEKIPVTVLTRSLEDFKAKLQEYGLTEIFFRYVRENYRFYRSAVKDVLFTGYYEADLRGSPVQTATYRYPLYRKPDDLAVVDLSKYNFFKQHKYKGLPGVLRGRMLPDHTIIPYYSREDIDYKGKLAGKGLEIVWIDNPVDVFFLHIQGSGIVTLDSGETLRVNYEESNGHPYRAIGRKLIEDKILTIENASMQSIRSYLESCPGKIPGVFCYNPSYVFFRVVKEGPMGALGVPVTPFRSIAADRLLFPDGFLCYIDLKIPEFDGNNKITGWKHFSGFVLNQDTGGAIRTPGRVDLFTGYGEYSRSVAGYLKQTGSLYFLLKPHCVKALPSQ